MKLSPYELHSHLIQHEDIWIKCLLTYDNIESFVNLMGFFCDAFPVFDRSSFFLCSRGALQLLFVDEVPSLLSNLDRFLMFIYCMYAESRNDRWYSCVYGSCPRTSSTNGYVPLESFYLIYRLWFSALVH